MNTFKFELLQYKKFVISWSIGFVIILISFFQFIPIFTNESQAILEVISGFGDGYLAAMGINPDLFLGFTGFYGYIFLFINLIGAIQALYLGIDLFSKEKRMKTSDFLFTKPQSRNKIFLVKFIVGLLILIIIQLIVYLIIGLMMNIVKEEITNTFILISITFSFIQFIFYSLSILLAILIKKIKSVASISVGIGMMFFILGMFGSLTNNSLIEYLGVLRYFDANYIIINNNYEMKYIIVSIIVSLVSLFVSYMIYIKRDIFND